MDSPPPDKTRPISFRGSPLEDVLYSSQDDRRALIVRDGAGSCRVFLQYWDISDWDIVHTANWQEMDQRAVFVDDLDRARSIAYEYLL